MSFPATVVQVMIASPGDVEDEREAAKRVLEDWNSLHAQERGIVLLPRMWETHAIAELRGPGQEMIDEDVLEDADILVGLFWMRVGTPTAEYRSGTLQEIMKHHEKGKSTMLFFSHARMVMDQFDREQFEGVKAAEAWARDQRGITWRFETIPELERELNRQLNRVIVRDFIKKAAPKRFKSFMGVASPSNSNRTQDTAVPEPAIDREPEVNITLPPRALTYLNIATSDGHGQLLLRTPLAGGIEVRTNKKSIESSSNAEVQANMRATLDYLEENGLLEVADKSKHGTVYRVTAEGFSLFRRLVKG